MMGLWLLREPSRIERVTRGRPTTALPTFTSKSSTEEKP
jgi:hypothetical protein